jgi:hypothetical protein
MEVAMMESIRVRQHVGQDGILHLNLLVGLPRQDVDVMVIYQPVPLVGSGRFSQGEAFARGDASPTLGDLYGICADDPIALDERGISEGTN